MVRDGRTQAQQHTEVMAIHAGDMKYNDGLAPYPGLRTASAWVQSSVLQDRQAGGERTDLGEEDTCMRKHMERVVIVMSMYLIHMLLMGR